MLTAAEFDDLVIPIVDLYSEFETEVIEDIARRLGNFSIDSAAWQVQRIIESGALYEDVIKKLARLTGLSRKTITEIFRKAGVKAIAFDDKIYKLAGLNPPPLNLSPGMLEILLADIEKTNLRLYNLTLTTASKAQQTFIRALDIAHLQVTTGSMSYDQAIRRVIKKIAAEGLDAIQYPSGRRDNLEVAVRRAVMTSLGQTTAKLQLNRADQMGQDLIAVSAHIGARNKGEGYQNHESWQGKIYSRTGVDYPDFVESTGYGEITGLAGINCRHSFYPFFKGISQQVYDEATLEDYKKKTVTYKGQQISVYDATQKQREIERNIRAWKRQARALEAAGLDSTAERQKIRQWQAIMRDFLKQVRLPRQNQREQIP